MQVDNYKIKKNTYLNRKVKMMDVKEKGVTIMSLVITIIVLLILAGITIKFAISDNGIIKQSQNAKTQYEKASTQEKLALNDMEKTIQNASNGTSGSGSASGGSSGNTGSSGTGENNSEEVDNLKKQIAELQQQVESLQNSQATGNAKEADVLSGKTFSNSSAVNLTGTMVSQNAQTNAVSVGVNGGNAFFRIPQGGYVSNASTGYPEIVASVSDINNATGYKYTQAQYDANYNTGYTAGKSSSNVVDLGIGTEFDVSNMANFKSFTINNFVISEVNTLNPTYQDGGDSAGGSYWARFYKTYDNLNGKLTCYINAGIQLVKPGGAVNRQSSTNMKVHVYFISNEIQ